VTLNRGLFTSARGDWATPQEVFDGLDAEFHFDLDPCAVPETAKCKQYYTGIEGLLRPWDGRVFCNPPYGRYIGNWVQKCAGAVHQEAQIVVALLPSRTDTAWFHDYVLSCDEIRFMRGRLHFDGYDNGAPFPSLIAIWRPL